MPITNRYGNSSSGSKFASRYKAKSSSGLDYEQLARDIGLDPEKEKNKKSFLENVFDIIGRPQQALFGATAALQDKPGDVLNELGGAWKGLSGQEHHDFEDILKRGGWDDSHNKELFTVPFLNKKVGARDIAGFAGDVVLDPLNLVGVGVASKAVKGIKVGEETVALSKAGSKALQVEKEAAKGLGLAGDELDNVARKTLADRMAADKNLFNKYVDKGGIKVAGKTVPGLSQKNITRGVDALDRVPVVNIPVRAARGAKNVADSTFDLFQQGYKAKKAGGEAAVDIVGLHKAATTNASDVASKVSNDFFNAVKKAKPKEVDIEDALQDVRRYVEKPDPSMPDWLKPHVDEFSRQTDEMRKAEDAVFKAAGREGAFVEDYYPRLFKNSGDEVNTVVHQLESERLKDPLRFKAGFTKERKLPDLTIDEIVAKGKEMGFDLQPLNAAEALGARTRSGLLASTKLDTAERLKGVGVPVAREAAEATPTGQLRQVEGAIGSERQMADEAARQVQSITDAATAQDQLKVVGKQLGDARRSLDEAVLGTSKATQAEITALRQQVKDLSQNYAQLKSIAKNGAKAAQAVDTGGVSSLFDQIGQVGHTARQSNKTPKAYADEFLADLGKEKQRLIDEHVDYLRQNSHKGVEKPFFASPDGYMNNPDGKWLKGFSKNDPWFRAALEKTGKKKLSKADYEAIARDHLENGWTNSVDGVPASSDEWAEYTRLENEAQQAGFFDEAAKDGMQGATEAKESAEKIASQTNPEGAGYVTIPDIKELEGFKFPPEVAKFIHKELTTKPKPKGEVLKALDSFAAIWKGSVTTLPTSAVAFNLRNKLGNMFNMYLAGVDTPSAMKEVATTSAKVARQLLPGSKGVKKIADKFGEDYTFEYLQRIGVMGGQVQREVGRVADNLGGKALNASGKAADAIFKPGQKIGEFVESPDRIALFIHARNQGKSVPESVAMVNKYLFDYSNPTATVKNIGRVIPFFTWTANNIPLQIERLVKTPGKYSHLRALYDSGISEEDRQNLPSYAREGLTISGGKSTDEEGNDIQRLLTNIGIPAEDLGRLDRGGLARTVEREILGAPIPILREPLEEAVGRDFFRGESLNDLSSTYGYQSRNYPKAIKDMIGYKETPYIDKNGKQRISYSVDPVSYKRMSVLPISRALDILFPSDAEGEGAGRVGESVIKGTAPVSVRDYNLTQGAEKNQQEAIERIRQALVKAGKLREYTNFYVPKDQQQSSGRGTIAEALARSRR